MIVTGYLLLLLSSATTAASISTEAKVVKYYCTWLYIEMMVFPHFDTTETTMLVSLSMLMVSVHAGTFK